jgi:hypothetical protein
MAKLRGENIALRNELLALMWAPHLRVLEEYEATQDRGEAATQSSHGRGIQASVRSSDTRATADQGGEVVLGGPHAA